MDDLLKEVRERFDAAKNELGFSSTYEQVEDIFYIEDFFQSEGYVSTRFSRALARRMTNLFWNWNNYLHNLMVPNPQSMVIVAESQMLSAEQKADILVLMNKILAHVTANSINSLSFDSKKEATFIDESVRFWSEEVNPHLSMLVTHVNAEWVKKASEPPKVDGGHLHP